MKDLGWQENNPFMPDLKTAEDCRNFITAGGLGMVEARIERAFSARFVDLKEKINRLAAEQRWDTFEANLLLTSILVDTRALFLESDRQKRNATLQNVYRARRMDVRADAIDAIFNENKIQGQSLKNIIKSWVDKRVVHIDWLWSEEEVIIFTQMESLIFGEAMKSLPQILLEIIDEYEDFVGRFGKDFQEQIGKVFEAMTGGMSNTDPAE